MEVWNLSMIQTDGYKTKKRLDSFSLDVIYITYNLQLIC